MSDESEKVLLSVDAVTRARAGGLAARGLSFQQIADILLLSPGQIDACRDSEEFKNKYAEIAEQKIQEQLDLADGWDVVETKALEQIIQTFQYNKDPKYALMAASIANKAERRKHVKDTAPVIDASQGGARNVIVIQMNKTYVNQVQRDDAHILDVTQIDKNDQPRKRVDLPNPQQVENLLAPVKQVGRDKILSELERAFEDAGVMNSINE